MTTYTCFECERQEVAVPLPPEKVRQYPNGKPICKECHHNLNDEDAGLWNSLPKIE